VSLASVWLYATNVWRAVNPDDAGKKGPPKFGPFATAIGVVALVLSCKGPVSPDVAQAVLTDEQAVCVTIAAIGGANTPEAVKIACPMLPALTADVVAAINALIAETNRQNTRHK
jgi:hypothetical protein